ncbi:T9SS type A sorting domain-containing protein [bacterium]|nr:T9SS type A sorting domain-containing protein [bacterium]
MTITPRREGPAVAACLAVALLLSVAAAAAAQDDGWVLTTDYSTFGRVRGLQAGSPWTVGPERATVPGDAVGRHHDGLVYVVGRGAANVIQVYDPQDGFSLVREFSVGAGRNPQDIAFAADGTAFVSCYDQAVLLEVDVEAGAVVATHSTAAFADADGIPETGWMAQVQDRLYVTAQLLDRGNWYVPSGPGAILVFDTVQRTWVDMDAALPGVQPIVLTGADPYTSLDVFGAGGSLHARVGCVGFFGLADGGIEEIDLGSGLSLGFVATEAQLGGDVTRFVAGNGAIYALISDAAFVTSVRRWDLQSGSLEVWATGAGYVFADLALTGDGMLLVADRTTGAAGMRVFDADTGQEITMSPDPTGLPPFLFVMPGTEVVAPVPAPVRPGLAVSGVYPNPCNPAARVEIRGPAGDALTVQVFDVRGRLVDHARLTADGQGRAVYTFAGRSAGGRPLASGVYRVRVQGAGQAAETRLTLLE